MQKGGPPLCHPSITIHLVDENPLHEYAALGRGNATEKADSWHMPDSMACLLRIFKRYILQSRGEAGPTPL